MSKERTLDRRQFTAEAALAMLSGVAITISGCGGSSPTAPSGGGSSGGGTPPTSGVTGQISANHGHTVSISQAELDGGGDLNLQLTQGDGHTHSLSLSGSQVSQIADGQRVSEVSSSDDAHTHTVTFN